MLNQLIFFGWAMLFSCPENTHTRARAHTRTYTHTHTHTHARTRNARARARAHTHTHTHTHTRNAHARTHAHTHTQVPLLWCTSRPNVRVSRIIVKPLVTTSRVTCRVTCSRRSFFPWAHTGNRGPATEIAQTNAIKKLGDDLGGGKKGGGGEWTWMAREGQN